MSKAAGVIVKHGGATCVGIRRGAETEIVARVYNQEHAPALAAVLDKTARRQQPRQRRVAKKAGRK